MADAADSPQGNNPDEPQRPDWLPENFESPEALVKSYQEAQNKIREQGTQLNALNENYATLAEHVESLQTQQAQPQQPQATDLLTAYEQAMENGDYKSALAINDQLTSLRIQQAVSQAVQPLQEQFTPAQEAQAAVVADMAWNSLTQKYGNDLEEHRQQLYDTISQNPWLIPDEAQRDPRTAMQAIENVYKMVNPAAFIQPTPEQQAQAQAQAVLEQKRLAQTASGAGGRPMSPDESKEEWERVKAAGQRSYWQQPQQYGLPHRTDNPRATPPDGTIATRDP